jgi:Zn-dependent protease with chaperone function
MHELTHWKEMHLFKMICADMLYMTLFALYLRP